MQTNLIRAGQLVAEAMLLVDPNYYPSISQTLQTALQELSSQIDYEDEAEKYRRES